MEKMRESNDASLNADQMISDLNEVAQKIPRSQFDDVNELKSELEITAATLEALDYESREEIISGDFPPEHQRAESYQEALTIYNSAYNAVSNV